MHHILVKLGYKPSPKTKQNRFTRTMPRMIIPNVCIFSQVGVIFQTQFTLLYHKMPQKWFGVWVCVEISDASANRLIGHMEDTTKMDLGRQSGMDWPLVPKEKMVGIFCPVRPCCKFLWPFCSWSAGFGKDWDWMEVLMIIVRLGLEHVCLRNDIVLGLHIECSHCTTPGSCVLHDFAAS